MPAQTLGKLGSAQREGALKAPVKAGERRADGTRALRRENARLRMERDILKSDGVLRQGISVKYAWIAKHRARWPITLACDVLEVSTSGDFEHCRRKDTQNPVGQGPTSALATKPCWYTSRRSTPRSRVVWLAQDVQRMWPGIRVGKDRVWWLMQRHGIKARGKRKFVVTTDSKHDLPIAPNLLARDFAPEAPNRAWSSDITYIATDEGWLYLTAGD